jgi:hypothetical protein
MVGRYGLYVEKMVFPSLCLPYVFTRRQSTVRHFSLILNTNHDYSIELGCKKTSRQPLLTLVNHNFRHLRRQRAEWEPALCATLVNRTRTFNRATTAAAIASIMSAAMGRGVELSYACARLGYGVCYWYVVLTRQSNLLWIDQSKHTATYQTKPLKNRNLNCKF